MKLEIDLNDILADEFGPTENLAESVRRQVVEKLTTVLKEGIGDRIDSEVSRILSEQLSTAVEARMPEIIEDLLNAEYVTVDRYGDRARKPTTFRKELVKAINENMVYKKTQYSNDATPFTKAVDAVVAENVAEFKKEFNRLVNAEFVKEAMAHAGKQLADRLGVKA